MPLLIDSVFGGGILPTGRAAEHHESHSSAGTLCEPYRLSYRDLVAMMAERGLAVSHTTILRWVIRYVPEFEKRWSRWARAVNSSWRVDETYICV